MDPNNQQQPVVPPADTPSSSAPQATTPPAAPQSPTGYSTSAPHDNKNPLKLILIIGGALLVVGIVVAVLVSSLIVSKKDYQDAYSAYMDITSESFTLSSKISSLQYGLSSGTDTSFNNDYDAAKDAVEAMRQENKELSELRAVKVGDGKKQYETFNTKLEKYLDFADDVIVSLKDMRGASVTCDEAGDTLGDNVVAGINDCLAALKKIGDTPNKDIQAYVTKMTTETERLLTLSKQMATITDPYGSQYDQYKSIRDQIYDVQDNLRDASTDFNSNFEKSIKNVDPEKASDEFEKFLAEKM